MSFTIFVAAYVTSTYKGVLGRVVTGTCSGDEYATHGRLGFCSGAPPLAAERPASPAFAGLYATADSFFFFPY